MKEKFAVIGLGLLGSGISRSLAEKGAEVLAIDNDEEKVDDIKDEVAYAVTMDSTDEKALRAQALDQMDAVVIAIGHNFEGLLLTAVLLKDMGVKRIVARASNRHQKMILEKVGISEIFAPDEQVGKMVAEMLVHPDIKNFLPLPDDYEIVEIGTPKRIANRMVSEIELRERYNLNLITVKRLYDEAIDGVTKKVEHIIGVPKSDTVLLADDILILLGKSFDIHKFMEINS